MIKKLKVIILLSVFSASISAITPEEILETFGQRLAIPELSGTLHVDLIAANGDVRKIEAHFYQKNINSVQTNRLFLFNFPPSVRDTCLLLHSFFDGRKNNMWIYLPTVRRVKRISMASSGGGYFMGSDFSYQDLINVDYNKRNYSLGEMEDINGEEHYTIKVWEKTPEDQQKSGYSYLINYHRKSDLFLMRRNYFDLNEDLLKVYEVESTYDLDPYLYPDKISMTNVQSGHRSVLEATNLSIAEIPDRMFTTRNLGGN